MNPDQRAPGQRVNAPAGPSLRCVLCPEEHVDRVLGMPLAVVHYRADAATEPVVGPLHVTAPFPQPHGPGFVEVWTAPGAIQRGELGDLAFAAGGGVLFGRFVTPVSEPGTLETRTAQVYRDLLRALPRIGFPHLLRVWNCVPRINADEDGLERYKRFCRGRSLAFQEHWGDAFPARLPSASAVGSVGDDLVVYFLAGRFEPRHQENPRQVAAWAYPPRYGPRSPSFARATELPAALGGGLFISGTASVLGHESVHDGDPLAQVDETMRNIAVLLHPGAALDPDAVPRPEAFARLDVLKVYVRHGDQLDVIRERVRAIVGAHVGLLFVMGDICRAELLVEIEGIAR